MAPRLSRDQGQREGEGARQAPQPARDDTLCLSSLLSALNLSSGSSAPVTHPAPWCASRAPPAQGRTWGPPVPGRDRCSGLYFDGPDHPPPSPDPWESSRADCSRGPTATDHRARQLGAGTATNPPVTASWGWLLLLALCRLRRVMGFSSPSLASIPPVYMFGREGAMPAMFLPTLPLAALPGLCCTPPLGHGLRFGNPCSRRAVWTLEKFLNVFLACLSSKILESNCTFVLQRWLSAFH